MLAETVRAWLAEPGVGTEHVAVLARVNSLLLAPHVALAEAGIPVDSVLRPDVLDRTGVRAALAYLRIGARPDGFAGDDVVEVYRRPSAGVPAVVPEVAPADSSTSTGCGASPTASTTRRWRPRSCSSPTTCAW